ncbi:ABC transporter-associated protein EcsC [Pueribacillus theae]|uniref:ABC transporter-associated protein EcsC n=1 Tax=Pueribacillus theae TaxID=2171751 RepID=A0A2U1K4C5_9BACI|nr:EcsC family protein [Pueribacillus theae]PWA11798.1 ABC transporter-associated protein EcsC [Pueribacillus theae]
MTEYEKKAFQELEAWEKKMRKRQTLAARYAKVVQNKINAKIPEKVHNIITESIKKTVTAVLVGSEYTTKRTPLKEASLEQREELVLEKVKVYKRIASAEGAGTGAGGLLLGAADFPLLLGIKMKFLFDAASLYGFDVKDYRERLYILHLFQLAFSSDKKRMEVLEEIKSWEQTAESLPVKSTYLQTIDWQSWQQEYRDHIDLVKLFQLLPGIGAVIGAYANYKLLDELSETAMNGYRMRFFNK